MKKWLEKPYHSLDYMLQERFKEKVYKITLNGGMSCPNRDGTLGNRGCIFCSAGGSGDFAADHQEWGYGGYSRICHSAMRHNSSVGKHAEDCRLRTGTDDYARNAF